MNTFDPDEDPIPQIQSPRGNAASKLKCQNASDTVGFLDLRGYIAGLPIENPILGNNF